MRNRTILLNSTVAFVLALLVMMVSHEFAHGVGALTQGAIPTIYPGSEEDGTTSVGSLVFIALAGPVWSLISGLIVLALPQLPRSRGFWRLFVLWFGLLSVQEFAGYLFTGFFTTVGDIGRTYQLLGAPLVIKFVVMVAGVALTYFTGRVATQRFLAMTDGEAEVGPQLRSLGLFAWLCGVVVVMLLSIPNSHLNSQVVFEFMGTLTSGIFLVFVRLFMKRVPSARGGAALGWPVLGTLCLVAVSVFRIVVLGPGLRL